MSNLTYEIRFNAAHPGDQMELMFPLAERWWDYADMPFGWWVLIWRMKP